MKFTHLILIYLSFFTASIAQTQLSLQDAWHKVSSYPLIQQKSLLIEASQIDLEIAKKQLLPSINGQYSNSLNTGRSIDPYTNSFLTQSILGNNYGIVANYILFDSKQIKNQIEANNLILKSLKLEKEITENELKYQVLLAFTEVLLAEEQLKTTQALVELSEENLSYYQKLYAADRIRYVNLLSFESENIRLKENRFQAESDYNRSKQKLRSLLLEPPDTDYELHFDNENIAIQAFPVSLENLLSRALFQSVDYRKSNIQKQIKNKKSAIVLGSKWPIVSAFSNVGTTYSSAARRIENNELLKIQYPNQFIDNLNMNVGIAMRVPIFNVNNYTLRSQKIKIETKDIDQQLALKNMEKQSIIEEAYLQLNNTIHNVKTQKERLEKLEAINQINQIGFVEGRIAFSDYLQSKRDLEQVQYQSNSLKYKYFVNKKQLEFYQNGTWQ